ncbi:VanZ family protein [Polaromonas sp. A23]|uniref:VanZ family protein n=1 Tax=Polaromonas sp. A23 TaxID=1944133 RepID=UPI0009D528A0|nr:VanZ family protein [Polaromonas sp. A23]OOG46256.1 VanZ family protein [Polaromonas sp. A23]
MKGGGELHEAERSENGGGVPTTSWPLALATVCLIVYASLYPFTEWRNQGISPLTFLTASLPRYWTGFDVGVNLAGYAPLGFLLALAALRSGRARWAVSMAVLAAGILSLVMESLQSYLPDRIPSNVDFVLNSIGAWLGACTAWLLEKAGALDRWNRFRARWFVSEARGALVLLALWPVALLFPASVPLGLGQVLERLEYALAEILTDTPFLEWLPVRDIELQPLVPGAEVICVALGALIPCLLGYSVVRTLAQRAVFLILTLAAGVALTALSAALSYGPEHAWAWLDLPVQVGLVLGSVLSLLLLPVPRRGSAALLLLALSVHLSMLNQAPMGPYFAETLQIWEQGRFIRFNGLAQWLGWLWPYAVLLYVLVRLSSRRASEPAESKMGS